MSKKSFKRVYVEITNRCNLQCAFCLPHRRPLEDLSPDRFEEILRQIKPYTNYIYLHVKGEPLLHPQLETILALCLQYGLQVNLTTNGTLLSKQATILLHSPALRQVNISVHSFSEQTNQQQTQYLQQIIDFAKTAAPKMHVNLRLWNGQAGCYDDTTLELLQILTKAFSSRAPETILQSGKPNATLAEHIYLSFDNEFQWPSLQAPFYGTNGDCQGLRSQFGILVDGTVVPCCLDGNGEAALGNLFITPLSTLLSDSEFQRIRNGFLQNKLLLPLCQHCGYVLKNQKKGKNLLDEQT